MSDIVTQNTVSQFEEIISFENLYAAHKRARCSKQHKREVIEFELHLSKNLWALHYDLKYRRYEISGYNKFMIYDPKEREIQAISYRDRIVQHSLCDNFLTPLLEKHLINVNCACRRGKGTDYAIKKLKSFMTNHYRKYGKNGCFIKLDIKKYFPSINHQILKQKLWNLIQDSNIRYLLGKIIDSYGNGQGLPMGNQSSQNFALLYLDRIDRIIKEKLRVEYYVRYMDDMIMLVQTKTEAQKIFEIIEEELKTEKLILNPKSKVFPLKDGIQFLGWNFKYSKSGKIIQTMKTQSKQRVFAKVKNFRHLLKNGKKTQEDKECVLASYKGHLQRGCSARILKKINAIIQS